MADEPASQLRRRRISGNPNFQLNLDAGYHISEGLSQGTPSPSYSKLTPSATPSSSRLLQEFKNKAQSFDVQIEECEEEEIIIESDDEGEDTATGVTADRPVTPTPVQDFGTNVVYLEGPQTSDFLKVNAIEHDCYTDVSDADSEGENEP
ncbi:uncharacterized protein LOC121730245 [Aricia agestis]|uniref:uncharacterized protein LOC121730245 n=1 Tax=Aricia agestis TaxID=91739 RepID=UPI001C205FBD|nr:uncharacterized protein LOC121730245 [Aricia agestis]XP_041975146.1 uncharacterized protein LOC121730245 [Aricia agestis]XP_041975147.1 uncharacterized protein LOC121730245 [Aricia agestis]